MLQKINTSCRYNMFLMCVVMLTTVTACKKWYGVPPDTDFLSPQATYTLTNFSPTIGRTTLYTGIFNPDGSTLPITFQIVNVRKYDGTPSTDLTQLVPVQVWKSATSVIPLLAPLVVSFI